MSYLRKIVKWPFLIGSLALILSAPSALSSSASYELKVGKRAQIRLPEAVRIGNTVLPRGLYQARCDHMSSENHEMVFTRMAEAAPHSPGEVLGTNQKVRVQCYVHLRQRKNKQTQVYISRLKGERAVTKIVIRGENVEHQFSQ